MAGGHARAAVDDRPWVGPRLAESLGQLRGCAESTVWSEVLTEDVLRATHQRGDRLRVAMNQTFESNGLAMHVSGVGSLMTVHGTAGPITSASDLVTSDDRLKELFFFHCLDAGFYLARRGFIALSIEITDGDIDAFLDIVERFDPQSS